MNIKTPVIGLPSSPWQKKAFKFAKKHPNLVKANISDFCYECSRHRELLYLFDGHVSNFEQSEYWNYYKGKKPENAVISKISYYKKRYEDIRRYGYKSFDNGSSIIITDDGCRIDGSHRLSILLHLNILETEVNLFIYEKLFSEKESKRIRKANLDYRLKTYNL
ncbi:MAG: hypothetical protein ACTSSP_03585 [Candidatus Asgardarchaeia archaeon]